MMAAKAAKKPLILVIHGPNLNMLGRREPEVYGRQTLKEIDAMLADEAARLNLSLETFQSNHEGLLVDTIQQALGQASGLIINPGAYTHTSIAIRDALLLLDIPLIEVHLSNTYKREAFRRQSMIADIVTGRIVGLGAIGYILALQAIAERLQQQE
ncbi:MAG: type II 3-dehydroquinate dehydratase [Desulfobacterales bacterium]